MICECRVATLLWIQHSKQQHLSPALSVLANNTTQTAPHNSESRITTPRSLSPGTLVVKAVGIG